MLHTAPYRNATVDLRDRWGVCVCVCVCVCGCGWEGEICALATVASLYSPHERTAATMTHSALQ